MRKPMDRSLRLKNGTRWRTFMRLLLLDDLITSYTNARPGAGLLVVDLNLGTASGLLRSVFSPSMASFLKRNANASFVPRLLSIGLSMSACVYRGLRDCN